MANTTPANANDNRQARLINSVALLEEPFKPGSDAHDKVFILAKITRDKRGSLHIEVDDNTPTAVINEKARDALGLPADHPLVSDVRAGKGPEGLSLVSGGANVILQNRQGEERVALLRRDAHVALGDHLTGGNGLVGEWPSDTMMKEANEEVALFRRGRGGKPELLLIESWLHRNNGGVSVQDKEAQLDLAKEQYNDGTAKWLTTRAPKVAVVEASPHHATDDQRESVTVDINGYMRERFRAVVTMEAETNTLALRDNVVVPVKDFSDIEVFDGEPFKRAAGLFTPEQILADKALPDIRRLAEKQLGLTEQAEVSATGPAPTTRPAMGNK